MLGAEDTARTVGILMRKYEKNDYAFLYFVLFFLSFPLSLFFTTPTSPETSLSTCTLLLFPLLHFHMQQQESTLKKQPPSAITNAYNGSLEQAYLLLDAIQMNRGERLGSRCLGELQ